MRILFSWLAAAAVMPGLALAQQGAKNGEWRTYGGDLGNTRYSPLDQIDATNFNKLEVAWRFKTDFLGAFPEYQFQSTPLMVHGRVVYHCGSRRDVACLDAKTGELLWMHSDDEGARADAAPRRLSGAASLTGRDGKDERILYVTVATGLIALDAKTGMPVAGFGKAGVVDLKLDDDQEIDLNGGDIGLPRRAMVAKNVVIIGAAHSDGSAPRACGTPRATCALRRETGKRLWIFHTIPKPGEFGLDTWLNDSCPTRATRECGGRSR